MSVDPTKYFVMLLASMLLTRCSYPTLLIHAPHPHASYRRLLHPMLRYAMLLTRRSYIAWHIPMNLTPELLICRCTLTCLNG